MQEEVFTGLIPFPFVYVFICLFSFHGFISYGNHANLSRRENENDAF